MTENDKARGETAVQSDQLFDVRGKFVVVTGGTRGIGYMLAQGFVSRGANVLITSRKADACRTAAAELSQFGSVWAHPTDISHTDGVESLANAISDRTDGVDVLINNAGATWGAPLGEFPDSGFSKILAVNVSSLFMLTQRLLPSLLLRATPEDPSRIINIGSVDGLTVSTSPNYSYGASKAAVHHLTRKLAADLAKSHVTVNAIAPGPFATKMIAHLLDGADTSAALLKQVPLGRIGAAEDIVGTAVFLASRSGSFVTGAVLPVDGGISGTR